MKITLLFVYLFVFYSCSKETPPPNEPPTAPILLYPENGANNIDLPITFAWIASTDVDGDEITYAFYIGTSETNLSLKQTGIKLTEIEINDLDRRTDYYWKVVATDIIGNEITSEINTVNDINHSLRRTQRSFVREIQMAQYFFFGADEDNEGNQIPYECQPDCDGNGGGA